MKKLIILFSIIIVIFILSTFYMKESVITLSNIFQKRICANSFCISKPKDWFPFYVAKNNKVYLLNLIDSDYFANGFKSLKDKSIQDSIVIFNKNNEQITIVKDNKINIKKFTTKNYIINDKNNYILIPKEQIKIYFKNNINLELVKKLNIHSK